MMAEINWSPIQRIIIIQKFDLIYDLIENFNKEKRLVAYEMFKSGYLDMYVHEKYKDTLCKIINHLLLRLTFISTKIELRFLINGEEIKVDIRNNHCYRAFHSAPF